MLILNPYSQETQVDNRVALCNTKTGNYIKVEKRNYLELLSSLDDNYELHQDVNIKETSKKLYHALLDIEYYIPVAYKDDILTVDQVSMVYLAVTNRCNLSCIHCCTDANRDAKDILSTERIKKLIEDIIAVNPKAVNITGGEPVMRADIVEILQYLRMGFQGEIILSTNGTLFTDEKFNKIIPFIDGLSISIDGYDDITCCKVRGSGVFSKVIKFVQKLHEHEFHKITLSMVVTKYTYENVDKFYELCDMLKVTPLCRNLQALGRGGESYNNLKVFGGEESKVEEVSCRACLPGKRQYHIDYDGTIYPCGGLYGIKDYIIGNVLETDFIKIVESQNRKIDSVALPKIRSWNDEKCSQCSIRIFCPLCLGEKHLLRQGINSNEVCIQMRNSIESVLWSSKV